MNVRGPGLARARRGAFLRDGRVISREAEEALFEIVSVLSEGEVRDASYFGSTMVAFPLAALAARWRVPLDAREQDRLLRAIEGSVRVHLRLMRMARHEAARRASGRHLGTAHVEMRFALRNETILVDVDVEMSVDVVSARAR